MIIGQRPAARAVATLPTVRIGVLLAIVSLPFTRAALADDLPAQLLAASKLVLGDRGGDASAAPPSRA